MQSSPVLQNVNKHIQLTEDEVMYFLSLLHQQVVPKKHFLLKEGCACNQLYFVESGTLRAYYLDRNGKESTIMFAVNDWWITDMYCFINRLPAMLHIETLESASIQQLSRDGFDALCSRIPKFERFFRIIMQNAYTREQLRVIQNLSLSAEERYDQFVAKYPQIVQQVTQKQIASYLGITPEFLSSIRAARAKK
ncbi:MAG: Crp/Fnr family transcriptional regulator [Bacteroidetes bacterium]|nr:Crp/Fnr family transcriptional regulator [Bacteroidota bacterium]